MVIRAAKAKLDIRQLPITYHPRGGESKLSSFRDGWRHLRFLLVHSPTHLFVIPGAALAFMGVIVALVSLSRIELLGREWQLHSMIAGSLLAIVGSQVLALGLCAHAYGSYFMGEREPWFDRMRARYRLEHGLALGGVTLLAGLAIAGTIVVTWIDRGFGALSEERLAVAAAALIIIGLQVVFSSFLLSILGLRRRVEPQPTNRTTPLADLEQADPPAGVDQPDRTLRPPRRRTARSVPGSPARPARSRRSPRSRRCPGRHP